MTEPAPSGAAAPAPAAPVRGHAACSTGTSADGGHAADALTLYRLMSWLSPAYPVGAYTYSHGLEWSVAAGDVRDAATAHDWIDGVLRFGSGRCDGIFLTHAARTPAPAALQELAELCVALAPSSERRLETTAQGRAFLQTTRDAWPSPDLDRRVALLDAREAPYPVVVGATVAAHGIAVPAGLLAYLHAFVANLVSAAVRLVPLGQTQGQRLMAALEPAVHAVAAEAAVASLDDLASASLCADIASMAHETQYTRLFRS